MRIVWSPLATQRVLETATLIAQDKPEAARRWAEDIFDAVEMLRDLPSRGRVVPEVGRDDTRELLLGHYRVVYRVEADRVAVLTVRHGSRLLDLQELQ